MYVNYAYVVISGQLKIRNPQKTLSFRSCHELFGRVPLHDLFDCKFAGSVKRGRSDYGLRNGLFMGNLFPELLVFVRRV